MRGDDQHAEAVGAEDRGQPGILEPALEHEAHGVGRQGLGGELPLLAQGRAEQGRFLGILTDPSCLQVVPEVNRMLLAQLAIAGWLFAALKLF